ncbi:MAG TPA: hypothetical protein VEI73_13565 [Candidatus Acidoferrum sp.]|nr:hypothetical protein [Candidatus Acidoferrum sp.]
MSSESYPFIREVRSPLTEQQLKPLDDRCEVVQFCSQLNDKELSKLAEFLSAYPKVPLRVYGYETVRNLEFLRYFPFLRGFQTDVWAIESIEGLRHLSSTLEFLGLGATKSKAHSLRILERFPALKDLFIEGNSKDISALKHCVQLESLTLRSVTLPDLAPLTPLRSLKHLRLKLGGTKNLSLLPGIGTLIYLELWRILGLSDVTAIGALGDLQFLFLQSLKRVSALPRLERLPALRRVHLEDLKSIQDLEPVSRAPNLAELIVTDMPQLQVNAFSPFVGHKTLKVARVWLRSKKKQKEIEEMLNLPPTEEHPTKWNFKFAEN